MNWLKRFFIKFVQNNPEQSASTAGLVFSELNRHLESIRAAGSVDGIHYTDTVERIKQLKREFRHSEAIDLLLKSVKATESESRFAGAGWGGTMVLRAACYYLSKRETIR